MCRHYYYHFIDEKGLEEISAPNALMAACLPFFLLQIYTEHLLCSRHCATYGLNGSTQDHRSSKG